MCNIRHMAYEFLANAPDRTLQFSPVISEDKQSEIIDLAADGVTIPKIAEITGISWKTISRYLVRDPLFARHWTQARQAAADLLADELYHVYDSAETVADAMIGRGKSDNLKSIVGWRNPGRYGQRLNVEVTQTVDLSKALEQARERAIPFLNPDDPSLAHLRGPNGETHQQRVETYREIDATRLVAKSYAEADLNKPFPYTIDAEAHVVTGLNPMAYPQTNDPDKPIVSSPCEQDTSVCNTGYNDTSNDGPTASAEDPTLQPLDPLERFL